MRIVKSIIGAVLGVLVAYIILLLLEDEYSITFYIAMFFMFGLSVFFFTKPKRSKNDIVENK